MPLPTLTAESWAEMSHYLQTSEALACLLLPVLPAVLLGCSLSLASVWLVFKSLQKEALSEWDFQVSQHPVLSNYSFETGGLGGWGLVTVQWGGRAWSRAGDTPGADMGQSRG